MRNLLSAKKAELENLLIESEAALEQEEERVHQLNTEKAKLQLNINNLEEQWVNYHGRACVIKSLYTVCHDILYVFTVDWQVGLSVCYFDALVFYWRYLKYRKCNHFLNIVLHREFSGDSLDYRACQIMGVTAKMFYHPWMQLACYLMKCIII